MFQIVCGRYVGFLPPRTPRPAKDILASSLGALAILEAVPFAAINLRHHPAAHRDDGRHREPHHRIRTLFVWVGGRATGHGLQILPTHPTPGNVLDSSVAAT